MNKQLAFGVVSSFITDIAADHRKKREAKERRVRRTSPGVHPPLRSCNARDGRPGEVHQVEAVLMKILIEAAGYALAMLPLVLALAVWS